MDAGAIQKLGKTTLLDLSTRQVANRFKLGCIETGASSQPSIAATSCVEVN
jgi:hypothetical protein